MPLSSGTRLGPYEILAPLGAGGMGEVYRAKDTKLDRQVAVKVLPERFSSDPNALARFEREAKAVAALSHPNILAIHDLGRSDDRVYAVMELLEGENLGQRLASGPLPQRKAIEIAREIALGLAAAHEKGIVHRDLKPGNLFLTRDGRVKILDFGLARQISLPSADAAESPTVTQQTEPGTVLGTVGYMAPEQLRGQPADARSDLFSLGAVLYEMLSGRRAFKGDTAIETMNAILKEDPPEISESSRSVPPGLERIVRHCLEKNPEQRFQSAQDLAFDLEALSVFSGVSRAPVAGYGSRKLALSVWLLVVAALGVAAAVLLAGRSLVRSGVSSGPTTFRRLTFRRGNVLSARFAQDGHTVVYSAAWEGKPAEIFAVRTDGTESRPIGVGGADLLAVSSKGEIAILLKKENLQNPTGYGTLARVPLEGGTPREVLEDVLWADWMPGGDELAVIRRAASGKQQLEFPAGKPLYESELIFRLRVSPGGDRVAFLEFSEEGVFTIVVMDRAGRRKNLSTGWRGNVYGPIWQRSGGELLFAAGHGHGDVALRAVTLEGRERVLLPESGDLILHDLAADGRILLERGTVRAEMVCSINGENREKEISWLDGSTVSDITRDGQFVLFQEMSEGGASASGGVFLRKTDGTPAVRLGDGRPMGFMPDGRRVLTQAAGRPSEILLLPTGPGAPRKLTVEGVEPLGALSLAGDKGFLIVAKGEQAPYSLYAVGPEGGKARRIPEDDIGRGCCAVSPQGDMAAYVSIQGRLKIVSLSGGGASRLVPNFTADPKSEFPVQWSEDGRLIYITRLGEVPARVQRVDLETGRREIWKELSPADPSGVADFLNVVISPDGRSYAYTYERVVASDLFVLSGLK